VFGRLDVSWLRWLVINQLKVGNKSIIEVRPITDTVVMKMMKPLERVLP
jgi:hypothetical protein